MTMKLTELPDELKASAIDGSKLPPITGDVKITMPADGFKPAQSPPPPIQGDMAVTEPADLVFRKRPTK